MNKINHQRNHNLKSSEYRLQKLNLLVPSVLYIVRLAKIYIFTWEVILKKIFYERRDYESVDERSLS